MKPLDKKCRDLTMICLSSLMLALTGCGESGGPAGPPGAHPMMGPPGATRPGIGPSVSTVPPRGIGPVGAGIAPPSITPPAPDKEKPPTGGEAGKTDDNNPLSSVLKVEEAGNLVSLASDIIAAGVNPFLNRLPRPIQTEATPADTEQSPGQPAPPPANPLDSVKLLGIVYNPKSPIALVSVEGAKYPSQLIRTGDVIPLTGGQAIIGRITQESIDIQLMGPQKDKRTMIIPDIIGYGSSKADSNSAGGPSEPEGLSGGGMPTGGMMGGSMPSAAPKMPSATPSATTPMGNGAMGGSPLGNLKKLAAGLVGGSSSGSSAKGPSVKLTEP